MLTHIDTDMGVDDALALVLADTLLGKNLHAISTVAGNVSVAAATSNARLILTLLNRQDVHLHQGASHAQDGHAANAEHVHGADGMSNLTAAYANLQPPSHQLPIQTLADLTPPSQKIALIGLGPGTNLPDLVTRYAPRNIAQITLMSGVFFDDGNITPHAEFNAHCDPHALAALLAFNLPITLVPLDICRKIQLPRTTVQSWPRSTPLARLIIDAHMAFMNHYQAWEGIDGCFPHDAITVLCAQHPTQFHTLRGTVTVDTTQSHRGRTHFHPNPAGPVTIVTGGRLKWLRDRIARIGQ